MNELECANCRQVNSVGVSVCGHCGHDLSLIAKNESVAAEKNEPEAERGARWKISRAQWTVAGLIVALAVGSLVYRLLVLEHLEQTAALFIGLPAILALALALTPKAKSATGMIMKGLTIALLMSGPLLGEGFICIVMSAPLFYLVGLVVGLVADHDRRSREKEGGYSKRTLGLMVLPFLIFSLEGVHENLSFSRDETVSAERTVTATPLEVEEALSHHPEFRKTLPLYLRMGFPKPAGAEGEGLTIGARRVIHFGGGEGHPGDLVMEVAEAEPGHVRFRALSDGSHISHWLDWKEADVTWQQVDANHTKVVWKLSFT
ncbi:MAG TPA: hypothetical protein VK619_04650, partial [Pyrinomonadaceae bacterium]|nr:hypothetical protein [Pyrinomonadaceae bacterium]